MFTYCSNTLLLDLPLHSVNTLYGLPSSEANLQLQQLMQEQGISVLSLSGKHLSPWLQAGRAVMHSWPTWCYFKLWLWGLPLLIDVLVLNSSFINSFKILYILVQTMPPQKISPKRRVTSVFHFIGSNMLIVDLLWAVQMMIEQIKLDYIVRAEGLGGRMGIWDHIWSKSWEKEVTCFGMKLMMLWRALRNWGRMSYGYIKKIRRYNGNGKHLVLVHLLVRKLLFCLFFSFFGEVIRKLKLGWLLHFLCHCMLHPGITWRGLPSW